jgi:threonine dehydratase
MPDTSARVKVDAVKEFGGTVDLIDLRQTTRKARVEELARAFPEAYAASAYDDPLVIEGNATLGDELATAPHQFDYVVAPVGGGGLTSGIITGLRRGGSLVPVMGAEPLLANDAARSLRAGEIVANETEPQTIADGARTLSVGKHNWAILKNGLESILEVPEENIREAVRLLFTLANLKAEPTGALSIAAFLSAPDLFRDQRVCCVISGGNADPSTFAQLIGG